MALGFGVDVWCQDSLVTGRLARGITLLAQALYGRLITPRGTLRGGDEEAAYGFDVSEYVGAVGYETALATLPGRVRAELLKDDRVSDVVVTPTMVEDPDGTISITLEIDVMPQDETSNFVLTMSVTETSAELLGFREAA